MYSKEFLEDAGERAITSGFETTVLAIGGATANVIGWDWVTLGGAFAAGAILSIASSFIKRPIGNRDSAGIK